MDGQSVKRFAARAEMYLKELSIALERGTYRPMAVRRVEIPKEKGKMRPLGIPAVKDRIVQTALKFVLEPIFEREFLKMSYGFRPGLGCKDALREVDRLLREGYTFVVDADLRSYFDTIPHARLMECIKERVSDGRVLELIEAYLHQDIVKEMEKWRPSGGTPQGAVISPLLANIYLHGLDGQMAQKGYRMVRYADDFVVLCRSAEEAQAALAEVKAWVEDKDLSLNAEKTHVGDCRQWGQGFDFLGYHFEVRRRWVRRKSLKAMHDRIRMRTKRTRGDSLAKIIVELNPTLRGWFNYFKHAHPNTFIWMDSFVRRRLRAIDGSRRSDRAWEFVERIISAGPINSSRPRDVHHAYSLEAGEPIDEETTDWRAVCGRTARTVRRAGTAKAFCRWTNRQPITKIKPLVLVDHQNGARYAVPRFICLSPRRETGRSFCNEAFH